MRSVVPQPCLCRALPTVPLPCFRKAPYTRWQEHKDWNSFPEDFRAANLRASLKVDKMAKLATLRKIVVEDVTKAKKNFVDVDVEGMSTRDHVIKPLLKELRERGFDATSAFYELNSGRGPSGVRLTIKLREDDDSPDDDEEADSDD